MTDLILDNDVDKKKRSLTLRFFVTAVVVVTIIFCALSVLMFWMTRSLSLQLNIDQFEAAVVRQLTIDSKDLGASNLKAALNNSEFIELLGYQIEYNPMVSEVAFFDLDQRLKWQSATSKALRKGEREFVSNMLKTKSASSEVFDNFPSSFNQLVSMFMTDKTMLPGFIPLKQGNELIGVMRVERDYSQTLKQAYRLALVFCLVILLSLVLLFLSLFYNFWRGIQTIEEQGATLSQQIARLSNLLTINKSMQSSMKSASRRAVELNEQFLRRVGSDLHDGPAQSIGYSVLRLDQISKRPESAELSHEFRVVQEALDDALDEIRGISSGLVLPELEEMTLAESLDQVITRHKAKSDAEITQYYQDLPEQIPLPIKICAYRFVQEGLNNAHRHGSAAKCRVTAQVKDDTLHLSLKDNGVGFRKSKLNKDGGHLGLMGLKDRIESLGGRFSINSELGVGTAIKVSVQLSE